MSVRFAKIYDAVAQLANPYVLPQEWSWTSVDPDSYLLMDPPAALAQLREIFSVDELVAAGVGILSEGELVLNPVLAAPDPGFIVLRKADGRAYDLATSAGCITGAVPVLRMFYDRRTQHGIKASLNALCHVVFKMADVVLLRSLGVAAVPAALLQNLEVHRMERLSTWVEGTWDIMASPPSFQSPSPRDDGPVTGERSAKRETNASAGQLPAKKDAESAVGSMGLPQTIPPRLQLQFDAGSLAALTADIPQALAPVAFHLGNIYRKLHVRTRSEAILKYMARSANG